MSRFDARVVRDKYKNCEECRRALVYVAKGAQQAERFHDMVKVMQELVDVLCINQKPMTDQERSLLCTAYKNVVGQLRAAHRTILVDTENNEYVELAEHYKAQIEDELKTFCTNAITLFESKLQKISQKSFEARVFHLKIVADYYRYMAEFSPDNENTSKAARNYKEAYALAERNLEATHPIRLGVALNYSVCYYEVLNNSKDACQMAKTAFNHAIAKLDDLDECLYQDSTLIMQLLRDNLTLWTADSSDR